MRLLLISAFVASSIAAHEQAHGKFDASVAEAHMKAFGAAFAADTFDAASLRSLRYRSSATGPARWPCR